MCTESNDKKLWHIFFLAHFFPSNLFLLDFISWQMEGILVLWSGGLFIMANFWEQSFSPLWLKDCSLAFSGSFPAPLTSLHFNMGYFLWIWIGKSHWRRYSWKAVSFPYECKQAGTSSGRLFAEGYYLSYCSGWNDDAFSYWNHILFSLKVRTNCSIHR